MKRLLTTLLILLLIITSLSETDVYASGIGVTIDGKSVYFTQDSGRPFIDQANRTQVPLRITMEAAGCSVRWDGVNRMAIVEKNGTRVSVPIGQSYILVNDKKLPNDTAALIKDGRTFLPIRAVLEAFGAQVSWNQTASKVEVSLGSNIDNRIATRAEVAHFFASNYTLNVKNQDVSISDIEGNPYENDILEFVKSGLISTYPDGSFQPSAHITRAEFASLLLRLKALQGIDVSEVVNLPVRASDIESVKWAEPGMKFALNSGIYELDGSGKVNPVGSLTMNYLSQNTVTILAQYNTLIEDVQDTRTYCTFGTTYVDSSGMSVNVTYTVKEKTGSYVYQISYSIKNTTLDKEMNEGTFRLMFADGTALQQYGFFGTLFPDDTKNRSYEFEFLKAKIPAQLVYSSSLDSEPELYWKFQ